MVIFLSRRNLIEAARGKALELIDAHDLRVNMLTVAQADAIFFVDAGGRTKVLKHRWGIEHGTIMHVSEFININIQSTAMATL